MSAISSVVAEARRLAHTDVGTHRALQQLAKRAEEADDDDLGTLVVAHAVLTRAAEQRAEVVAREEATERERRRTEARQAVEARKAALGRRTRTRATRLKGQLTTRLTQSVIYAAFVGFLIGPIVSGSFVERTGPILAVCAVAVAGSVIFDWFAYSEGAGLPHHDPEGRLRELGAGAGIMLGIAPWLRFVSEGVSIGHPDLGPSLWMGSLHTYWTAVTLPIALSCGWILGGILTLVVGGRESPTQGPRIVRAQRFLRPFSWLGFLSAVSALIMYNWSQLSSWLVSAIGSPQVIPLWNPGDLWSRPDMLIVLGVLAVVLHYAARYLSGRAVWLGITACALGPILGLATLFTNPGHIVTWFLDWFIRSLL